MSNELTAYAESLSRRFELIIAAVRGLDAAQLNWRPPVNGANSVWVLATHTAGNARAWILGIACGRDIGRMKKLKRLRKSRPREIGNNHPGGITPAGPQACQSESGRVRGKHADRTILTVKW